VLQILDHLPRLRRYARALTGDRFAADDLVQDTVERALSRATLWRPGSKLDSWLLTIMHNLFVNGVRSAASRLTVGGAEEDFDRHPGAPADPAARLDIRDLDAALAKLPPEQREVLLLIALEDCSYSEAASILGIPVGTVMSRLSRARDRLRLLLSGDEIPPSHLRVVGK
jgi:RNA polymerase sigma-70 factor (ECF subfamily)